MPIPSKASYAEAICGVNYATRLPQAVASTLGKTPLGGTGLEGSAVIGEGFAVEALGAFNAVHAVGGIVETGAAIRNLSASVQVTRKRREINALFEQSQHALAQAHGEWKHTGPDATPYVQTFCDAARQAEKARAAKATLDAARERLPEQLVDTVRYTAVSWMSRVFSVLKLAFKAATWLSLAASILGVIGSAFQALSGIVKWCAASKVVLRTQHTLKRIDRMRGELVNKAGLRDRLLHHLRARQQGELAKARDKRSRARVEAIAGICAAVFSVLAFAFPPLGFVAIAIGLAYAGYRIYKGIRSWASARASNRRENAMRTAFLHTIRQAVERVQRGTAQWLRALMARLGAAPADADAVFVLARANDADQASRCLERLLVASCPPAQG